MKRLWFICIFLAVCYSAAGLEAGAGKVDITPPVGTPLSGDLSRMGQPSISVHDPISARALYISDGTTAILWATADLWLINDELRARVMELAPQEVPRENIILTATNTHNGPGGMMRPLPFRLMSGRFVPEVLETTAQGIAGAMRAAIDAKKPASAGFATVEQSDLTVNRHAATGPRDPQLGVLRVEDADGHPIAIVANLAAQPATVGPENKFAISADYPGTYYQQLELLNVGCVAMFAPGAAGDQDALNAESKSGWARTEAFGKLLAERVNELAGRTSCSDVKLRVASSSPALPAPMAPNLLPANAPVQLVEIGGLSISFFPGEACAELNNELRQRALDAGYAAHYGVNTSNGYFGYFPPRGYYAQPLYESRMDFYGPGIDDWFLREFRSLMAKAPAAEAPPVTEAPAVDNASGVNRLVLKGSLQEIGKQRGAVFGELARTRFQDIIVTPVQARTLQPDLAWWTQIPSHFDTSQYALPILGERARRRLLGLSDNFLIELEGVADGSQLPFDAVWLSQNPPINDDPELATSNSQAPRTTMIASAGDRAGVDALFVGQTAYGPAMDDVVVIEERPTRGRAVLQVTSGPDARTCSGMNDRGLVVCVERVPALGNPGQNGPQMEYLAHDMLHQTKSVQEAIDYLQRLVPLRGYRLLLADSATPAAVIVDCAGILNVRKPEKGLLFSGFQGGESKDAQPGRIAQTLQAEHIVGSSKIRTALVDTAEPDAMWRAGARYAVVFEPRAGSLRIALPNATGAPGEFVRIAFEGSEQ